METTLASSITKAASKQTYYTIRFLVDRERVEDAYRTYAYFRWVDDILDANSGSVTERKAFLERQKSLLEAYYRGEPPRAMLPSRSAAALREAAPSPQTAAQATWSCASRAAWRPAFMQPLGGGKATVDSRFSKTDNNTFQSSDFDSAANKVVVTVKSGAGNVSVNTR